MAISIWIILECVKDLVKNPCGKCERPFRSNRGIQCEDCMFWHHIKCIEMTVGEYNTFQFQPIVGFVKTVKTVFFQILQIHALKRTTKRQAIANQAHPNLIMSL